MSKKETPEDRARKAFKSVADSAETARKIVIRAQRDALAAARKDKVKQQARMAQMYQRRNHMGNHQIAARMGISESTVRSLLAMNVEDN